MGNKSPKLKNTISLSEEEYSKFLEVYKKLGQILISKKIKKIKPSLKSLYGIWEGVKVDKEDFEKAKKSLFKTSL